ncbi:MAG: SMC-Scp complex subunit ScpB [Actinomycetota bacterium]
MEQQESLTATSMAESKRAIEAIVLVSSDPIPAQELAQLLELPVEEVESLCRELAMGYDLAGHGFQLVEVAGGWRYQTHPDLHPYVERYAAHGMSSRLSSAALETLAIVAYKQPISRAQVSAIRGVNVDGVLRTLAQRGYVEEVGRDMGAGQAILYGTTGYFLERLGINATTDLPALGEFVPSAEVVEALEQTLKVEVEPLELEDGEEGGPSAESSAEVVETQADVATDGAEPSAEVVETQADVATDGAEPPAEVVETQADVATDRAEPPAEVVEAVAEAFVVETPTDKRVEAQSEADEVPAEAAESGADEAEGSVVQPTVEEAEVQEAAPAPTDEALDGDPTDSADAENEEARLDEDAADPADETAVAVEADLAADDDAADTEADDEAEVVAAIGGLQVTVSNDDDAADPADETELAVEADLAADDDAEPSEDDVIIDLRDDSADSVESLDDVIEDGATEVIDLRDADHDPAEHSSGDRDPVDGVGADGSSFGGLGGLDAVLTMPDTVVDAAEVEAPAPPTVETAQDGAPTMAEAETETQEVIAEEPVAVYATVDADVAEESASEPVVAEEPAPAEPLADLAQEPTPEAEPIIEESDLLEAEFPAASTAAPVANPAPQPVEDVRLDDAPVDDDH